MKDKSDILLQLHFSCKILVTFTGDYRTLNINGTTSVLQLLK